MLLRCVRLRCWARVLIHKRKQDIPLNKEYAKSTHKNEILSALTSLFPGCLTQHYTLTCKHILKCK